MTQLRFLACQISRFDRCTLLLGEQSRLIPYRERNGDQGHNQWRDREQNDFLPKFHNVLLYSQFIPVRMSRECNFQLMESLCSMTQPAEQLSESKPPEVCNTRIIDRF